MTDLPPFEPSHEWRRRAEEIAAPYAERAAALIPLLQAIQERHGHVSEEAQAWAAEALGLPRIRVHEVMSFYTMLRRRPPGRHHLRVCRNLSCTLLGAESLVEAIEDRLGCPPGETASDGSFSWELVECMGACETAPMLQCDDVYVGPVTEARLDEVLESPPTRPEPPPAPPPAAAAKRPARKPASRKKRATKPKEATGAKTARKPAPKAAPKPRKRKPRQRRGLPRDD